jgi:hypothetical protein
LPRQAHQLFLAAEMEVGPVMLNLGLGRGLTPATDRWVVKAHVGYLF